MRYLVCLLAPLAMVGMYLLLLRCQQWYEAGEHTRELMARLRVVSVADY